MKAFCIIGATGSGKSTLLREKFLKKVRWENVLIFDFQNEHGGGEPPPIEEFIEMANQRRNSLIVFEEASIFFAHAANGRAIRELLTSKRHRNNVIVFLFHAINQVPVYLLNYINNFYILKTEEEPDLRPGRRKYKLYKALEVVLKMPEHSSVYV